MSTTSSKLDPAQIVYLQQVLGVESLVLDATQLQPEIKSAPKLLVFAGDLGLGTKLEATELLKKMIQAMKLTDSDVAIFADLSSDSLLESFPEAPLLIFGKPHIQLAAKDSVIGELTKKGSRTVLWTHSLETLLANANDKKSTWTHLQKLMKVIR
jgi:hypothetical protein